MGFPLHSFPGVSDFACVLYVQMELPVLSSQLTRLTQLRDEAHTALQQAARAYIAALDDLEDLVHWGWEGTPEHREGARVEQQAWEWLKLCTQREQEAELQRQLARRYILLGARAQNIT